MNIQDAPSHESTSSPTSNPPSVEARTNTNGGHGGRGILRSRSAIENGGEPGLALVNDALRASAVHLESDGLERFLETIVRHAVEAVGATAGWFALSAAHETQFEIVAALKRNMRSGGLVPIQIVERTLPLTGFASDVPAATAAGDEPYWQRLDRRQIPAEMRWGVQQGQREALLVPLRFGSTKLGMLSLLCNRQGRPSEASVDVARLLGQQAAMAIGMQHQSERACEVTSRVVVEAERSRMAGEIHDGIAQAFLSIMVHARAARLGGRPDKQRLLTFLEEIEAVAAAGLEEARRSVFALRSAFVERDGLICALERLVDSLSMCGRTRFALVNRAGALDVSPAVGDTVYRIVQEATQNALKHAGAQFVLVQLEHEGSGLRVRIEDDGDNVTQDVIQCARERGGLRAMRERAERCGGSFLVERCLPHGTRVDVLLPLKELSV